MASAFVKTVDSLSLQLGPLQKFIRRNDFPEFFKSAFPVFALDTRVSESDLKQLADTANRQAQAELGFDEAELKEMGYVAAIPQPWQLCERAPIDVVRWYHDEFDKSGSSSTREPQWYPLGFLGVTLSDWKNAGVLLVFYDAVHDQASNSDVPVRSFVIDPDQIGSTLISLRQGDTDYEAIRRHSALS
jgi:hypothetical protein